MSFASKGVIFAFLKIWATEIEEVRKSTVTFSDGFDVNLQKFPRC